MTKDFVPSDRSRSQIIAKEAAAHIAWSLLYPFGIKASKKRTKRVKTQRTIIFVHGYIANRASFFPMAAYLKLTGIHQTLSFNYTVDSGIDKAAIELKKFIKQRVKGGTIDLVCHSLGGLIASIYLSDLGGARRVDRCITIGTPHKGTYSSYWAPTKVADQLRPDSSLLARISAKRLLSSVRFTSIVGGSDNIVIPRIFAAGSDDVVHIPHTGHVGLLFSLDVFRTVASRLQTV